jgi:two-component system OmpR family sensor kinase
VNASLQFRLSLWLGIAIFGVALVAGAVSFEAGFQDAIELQDDQLRQVAALMTRSHLPATATMSNVPDIDPDARLLIQILPRTSQGVAGLPGNLPDGLQTVRVNGVFFRLFVKSLDADHRVAVGQQTDVRDEIAQNSGLRTLIPFLLLIPPLTLLAAGLIRKALAPLKDAARALDLRAEGDVREMPVLRLPSEVLPFVVAINRLLRRVAQSAALQRRFVADAAHELRSPFTALSLQAERLETMQISTEAKEQVTLLRGGIQRTRLLLEQLLAFARVQEASPEPIHPVLLSTVFRDVLEALMPLAEARNIDIGVVGSADISLPARPADLRTLLKNLVENAIRYAPANSRIDLAAWRDEGEVLLQIDDAGPGIAQAERTRVFDPFYRVLGTQEAGSGLGLSIVKTILDRMGATITLDDVHPQAPHGLRVRIVFPEAKPGGLSLG